MQFNSKLLVTLLTAIVAPSALALEGTCYTSKFEKGVCISNSNCRSSYGTAYHDPYDFQGNYSCPWDPDGIECCVIKINVNRYSSRCLNTGDCPYYSRIPGYCPGSSNVQLCYGYDEKTYELK